MTLDARPDRTSHRPGDEVVDPRGLYCRATGLGRRDAPGRRGPALRRGGRGGPEPGVARGRRRRLLRGPPRRRRRLDGHHRLRRHRGRPGAAALRLRHRLPARTRRRRRGGRLAARVPPQRHPVLRLDVPARRPPAALRRLRRRAGPVAVAHERPPAAGRDARGRCPGDRLRRGLRRRTRVCGRAPRGRAPPPGRPALDARRLPLDHGRLPRVDLVAARRGPDGRGGASGRLRRAAPRPVRRPEGRDDGRRERRRPRGRVRGAHRGGACGAARRDADLQQRQRLSDGDDRAGAAGRHLHRGVVAARRLRRPGPARGRRA